MVAIALDALAQVIPQDHRQCLHHLQVQAVDARRLALATLATNGMHMMAAHVLLVRRIMVAIVQAAVALVMIQRKLSFEVKMMCGWVPEPAHWRSHPHFLGSGVWPLRINAGGV